MEEEAEYIGKYVKFIRMGLDMHRNGQEWRLRLGQKMRLAKEELLKARLKDNQQAEEELQYCIKNLKEQMEELEEQLEELEEQLE